MKGRRSVASKQKLSFAAVGALYILDLPGSTEPVHELHDEHSGDTIADMIDHESLPF